VKNLVDGQYPLFTGTWRHSKFGSILCKIRGEKHYTTLVKVVGGSEIYNFHIHHFVHFYSKFLRKSRSNVASPTQEIRPGTARAPARQPHPALGIRTARLPRPCAPSPCHPASLGSSEFSHPAPLRTGRHRTGLTGPSAVSAPVRAYQGRCRTTASW
jgi:hypothetical protein